MPLKIVLGLLQLSYLFTQFYTVKKVKLSTIDVIASHVGHSDNWKVILLL